MLWAAAVAALALGASADCVFQLDTQNVKFDLTPLGELEPMSFTQNPLVYKFAACAPVPNRCTDGEELMAYAAAFNTPTQCSMSYGTRASTSVTLLGSKSEGVQLEFKGGTCSSNPQEVASTTLDVQCDSGGDVAPHAVQLLSDPNSCGFHIQFKSSAGCGISLSPGEVLSPVAIGLIVVGALLVLYLGCGFAYNSCARGASGIEAVPNIDFWRGFCGRISACCGCAAPPSSQSGFYTDMTIGEDGAIVGGEAPYEDDAAGAVA